MRASDVCIILAVVYIAPHLSATTGLVMSLIFFVGCGMLMYLERFETKRGEK